MSLGAPSTTAAPLSTHAHGDPAPRPASCQPRECSSFRLAAAGEDGWRGAALELTRIKHALCFTGTTKGHAVKTHTHRRRRTLTTVPIPNQRWKIRIPSVNAGTRSARTVVLRRRQYNARSTLALLITPFAGRSPFTAFILGCELSLQPCLVVQRMIVPFEQNVLLEVLRREPALMCPCSSTLSTPTPHPLFEPVLPHTTSRYGR